MTRYEVQYVLPVDNPMSNVRMTRGKTRLLFEVPINYPDAHRLNFQDLVAAVELSGLHGVIHNSNTAKQSLTLSKKNRSVVDKSFEEALKATPRPPVLK